MHIQLSYLTVRFWETIEFSQKEKVKDHLSKFQRANEKCFERIDILTMSLYARTLQERDKKIVQKLFFLQYVNRRWNRFIPTLIKKVCECIF